ncbi:MAG: efflux RND transporter permease subunit, partial [Candidatus Omnitrophica bacterium]|nr:efflux RND transporter permease subunit [Candidatus Omnitrophota bacterium]
MSEYKEGFVGKVVRYFADSKLTPLIVAASILVGVFAVGNLPREEEPQISVPVFDVFVAYPGASAEQVERRIVNLGERKLWEIPGVEYIYSTAEPNGALFIVRFEVGHDEELAAIKTYSKVYSNLDFLPPDASQPLIKLRSINDVPILALTFHSKEKDLVELRRSVAHLRQEINAIPDVSETALTGGRKRQFQVFFDENQLKQRLLSPLELLELIQGANVRMPAHHLESAQGMNTEVEANALFRSVEDLEQLVVGISQGSPVYLKDVARVVEGPDEEERGVRILFGHESAHADEGPYDAVTLAVSKRQGASAAVLADQILERVSLLKGNVLPEDIQMTVTRNYGETATQKSNELLFHMGIAVIGVSVLIALFLGIYESGVVAVAIPMTLALTLATFYFLGFTLNRITLFALIFSIGILVDDPIVDVENIVRHLRLPKNRGRNLLDVSIEAVN